MKKDIIKFQPFEGHAAMNKGCNIILIICGMVFLVNRLFVHDVLWDIIMLWFGITSILLKYETYRTSKIMIHFESEGIRYFSNEYYKERFYPWEDFSYGYYFVANNKGFTYIALSRDPISDELFEEIKEHAHKKKTKGDFYKLIILCLQTPTQSKENAMQLGPIIQLIKEKVPNIEVKEHDYWTIDQIKLP